MIQQWEYMTQWIQPHEGVAHVLNTLGASGWELVCVWEKEGILILKRKFGDRNER